MELKINSIVKWDSAVGTVEGVVKKVVQRGRVPEVAIDISGTKSNPAYQIEVLKDGKPAGVLVGKLHSDLVPIAPVGVEETWPYLTQAQVDKVNRFRAKGLPPVKPEEMVAIEFIVADNLVNRGKGKWREKDLRKMAGFLDAMGLPFIPDHNWEEIEDSLGIIIGGKLVKAEPADQLLNSAGNGDLNREIVSKEGFWQTIATVAFPIDSEVVQRLRFGIGRAVSLGGFSFKDYVCPICDTSFSFKNCPHYIPDYWAAWEADDPALIAPYYIRDGLYDVGELANVVIANLPGAEVVMAGAQVKEELLGYS